MDWIFKIFILNNWLNHKKEYIINKEKNWIINIDDR